MSAAEVIEIMEDIQILRGSGDTPQNRATLRALEKVLPANEYFAVCIWLAQFFGFQQNWVLDPSMLSVLVKCRRIGGSLTYCAAPAVLWSLVGETTIIVSKGLDEAKEVFRYTKQHLQFLQEMGSEWAQTTGTNTSQELNTINGGRIIVRPSTSAGRSFGGNVILDEHAYMSDPQAVWDAASGATFHNDRMRVCSTPNGEGNSFHDLVVGDNEFVKHEVTVDDAIADGMEVDLDMLWAKCNGDQRLFDQLYRCKFLDSNLQYFTTDLIKAASSRPVNDQGLRYGGLDIAESKDRTVLCIGSKSGEYLSLNHVESHQMTDDDLIDKLVQKAIEHYGCKRVAIDATGIGLMPAKRLRRKWGSRVEQVTFSLGVKEELATGLYDRMTQQNLAMPEKFLDDNKKDLMPEVRSGLQAIRRIVTQAGNVRYDAQRNTKHGHADAAWSLMLMNHAAGRMSRMFSAYQQSQST